MNAIQPIDSELFKGFNPSSKIWIYASDRILISNEVIEINEKLAHFTTQWVSHNKALKAGGKVILNRFIILVVDESLEAPSGCSIDKSINFIKSLETQFGIGLFDRLTIYYPIGNEIKSFHFNEIRNKIEMGEISEFTHIYDATLTKLDGFKNEFVKVISKSWMAKYIT